MLKLGTTLHRRAMETDEAWGAELARLFGKNAGDVRYAKAGQGAEGSELRRLYDERTAAQTAWHND